MQKKKHSNPQPLWQSGAQSLQGRPAAAETAAALGREEKTGRLGDSRQQPNQASKNKRKKIKNKKLYKYIYTQKGRRCARDNRRWRDIQGKPPFANISD